VLSLEEQIIEDIKLIRPILDQIADKWSILVLSYICEKPQRFNAMKRRLEGITQKALTQTLRRLERNGLISRKVKPVSPVVVEYSITPLGLTLRQPFNALFDWARINQPNIGKAQKSYDLKKIKEEV
jgi:DNA-binding HxlR family transcriptional regulator